MEGKCRQITTFPFSRFCFALPNDFFFNVGHEDVGKCDCHYFGTHRGAMGLEKVLSTELETIFLEYEAKYIFKISERDRRVVIVESFVCFAYWLNSFLLWYVCIQACNIQRN